eukprot:CAMPEP_0195284096 /NCGR_PEP_ID=MMETSP0707-20130614/2424_1 /TAXON_ID=33640 /ORGANISM="Asterionellopsis glacialis, Strain CCMP134" /LENGTH=124 /DNA_ID=CAMNT_0040343391 /DNA_START=44 /DNA_END=418 /DNA_ORIENTATION=-
MANPAAIVGWTTAAMMVVIAALIAACKRLNESPEVVEDPIPLQKNIQETAVEDIEMLTTNSSESAAESKPEQEQKPRKTKASTCDVRNCQSFSCSLCQSKMEPQFFLVDLNDRTVEKVKKISEK